MKVEIVQDIDKSVIPDDLIEFCREISFKYACAVNNLSLIHISERTRPY